MTTSEPTPTLELLWTGGWDSTFRLLDIVTDRRCQVQPYYVVHRKRQSWSVEVATRKGIEREILDRQFPGRVLPTIFIEKTEIMACSDLSNVFERLQTQNPLGSQYEWLARLARQYGLSQLELAIHKDDRAHAFLDGHVQPVADILGATTYELGANAPEDLRLFRAFQFPIFQMTKLDMAEVARQRGFLDILERSWFCYRPLSNGRPCGVCDPCTFTIREGLSERIGWRGLCRYHTIRQAMDLLRTLRPRHGLGTAPSA